MNYFITAIGTDSGKTVASAILCEALEADYWKPVQAGLPRDTETVKSLVSNNKCVFHPERYLLNTPASPHAAAKIDNVEISLKDFSLPETSTRLVIEGAGGCLVPLNDHNLVIDLISVLQAEVIVVSNHYLGSINHTLLTLEALRQRKLPVKGIIFNGETTPESERIILLRSGINCVLRIQKHAEITPEIVKEYAALFKKTWHE